MSPKFSVDAPVPTTVAHQHKRLTLVASSPDSCTLLGNTGFCVSSSCSNTWSFPSVLQLFTLSNRRAMTTDVWVWRQMASTKCIALLNIALHRKMATVPSHIHNIFSVAHTPSVPRTLHCLSTLSLSCSPSVKTALFQSDTGFWCARCGTASSVFPQGRTARAEVATSRAILLQAVPSQLFTTVLLFVSENKKNFLHHRRLTRLHTT